MPSLFRSGINVNARRQMPETVSISWAAVGRISDIAHCGHTADSDIVDTVAWEALMTWSLLRIFLMLAQDHIESSCKHCHMYTRLTDLIQISSYALVGHTAPSAHELNEQVIDDRVNRNRQEPSHLCLTSLTPTPHFRHQFGHFEPYR